MRCEIGGLLRGYVRGCVKLTKLPISVYSNIYPASSDCNIESSRDSYFGIQST